MSYLLRLFEMIAQFLASDSIESMTSALLNDGAVIIKQLVGNEVIERFNDDLRAEFDRQGHLFQGDFNGYKTRRVGAVAKYSKEFPSLLAHPTILQLADVTLKPHCEVYQSAVPQPLKSYPVKWLRCFMRMTLVIPVTLSPSRCRFQCCGRLTTLPRIMVRPVWS